MDTNSEPKKKTFYSGELVISMLDILIDNIIVGFGGSLIQHIVVIPMEIFKYQFPPPGWQYSTSPVYEIHISQIIRYACSTLTLYIKRHQSLRFFLMKKVYRKIQRPCWSMLCMNFTHNKWWSLSIDSSYRVLLFVYENYNF